MEQKYMMDVNDVIKELGVSRSKAYQILRQLNQSLEAEGYQAIAGKIPRPYWETKFYGYTQMVGQEGRKCQFIKTKNKEHGMYRFGMWIGQVKRNKK